MPAAESRREILRVRSAVSVVAVMSASGITSAPFTSRFFGPPSDGFLDEQLSLAHQVSFEQLLVTFDRDEHRPISVAHYILGLSIGCRSDLKLTSSLETALRRFFAEKLSPRYQTLVNYEKVPELRDVVELAERLIEDREEEDTSENQSQPAR